MVEDDSQKSEPLPFESFPTRASDLREFALQAFPSGSDRALSGFLINADHATDRVRLVKINNNRKSQRAVDSLWLVRSRRCVS
jgi:hypothetical protein